MTEVPTEDEIIELQTNMTTAHQNYIEARLKWQSAVIRAYKFKPGDVIRSTKGQFALVRTVDVDVLDNIKVMASPQKVDMSFSRKSIAMWRQEWIDATLATRPGDEPKTQETEFT